MMYIIRKSVFREPWSLFPTFYNVVLLRAQKPDWQITEKPSVRAVLMVAA
jgi:hypothetical protein